MKKWFKEKILSNNKNTMLFITITCFFVLAIYQTILFCYGTYFNSNSDDFLQYSPILVQYINYFKEGKLSFYNFTNNLGASSLADIYYVPLDIFTLLVFLLSFVMDGIIAFSIINLCKVLFGVVVFSYFLQRKSYKNSIVILLSMMYFAFGGIWVLATYPTYFSLFFYLPLCLLVLDYFVKGKKWLLPLYCCELVFYNFYNAYTLFIFMLGVYVVIQIRDNYSTFKNLLKKIVSFGLHIVLGVLMSMAILLPSVLYILNYSNRTGEEIVFVFNLNVYFKMIYKLFVYESGVSVFGMMGDYVYHQFSYYVGIMGMAILMLLFFMKDRVSKIYKRSLMVIGFMMIIPLFSMIFSGVGIAYTRWFNFINIILIYMIGHVLENFNFKEDNRCIFRKIIIIISILYLVGFALNIVFVFSKNDSYILNYNMLQMLIIFILFGIIMALYFLFYFANKKDLLYSVFVIEMCIAIIINFSIAFNGKKLENIKNYNSINEVLDSLSIDDNSLERVYVIGDVSNTFNFSRYTDVLVNENTFHSFMTKYMYHYKDLYNGGEYLYTYDLNRFNPNNSRLMDYKYVVVDKNNAENSLSFLDYYGEMNGYIIYENKNYNPFYVYENYYKESHVIELNENSSYLDLERKLFEGVILENGEYNLNEIDFNYDDSIVTKYDVKNNAHIVKVSENIYELDLVKYNSFGYEGKIIFNGIEKIDNIVSIKKDDEKVCDNSLGVYKCEFNSDVSKIVITTEEDIRNLNYLVSVEIDDSKYAILLINNENLSYEYLNFYYDDWKSVILKNGENERLCLNGLCKVKNFEFNHILLSIGDGEIYSEDNYTFEYYFDSLDKYNLNKEDKFASNKSLIYNKETINVSYKRESISDKDQVIVLPITYSDEWILNDNENYKIVRANGGYLGVLVENGIDEVNVSLSFRPNGIKLGLIGSFGGFGVYGVYCFIVYYNKRKKDNNENF